MTDTTDHADDDEQRAAAIPSWGRNSNAQRAAAIRELQRLFGVLEASIVTRHARAHAMVVSNLLPTEDELRADPEWHRAMHRALDAERRITDAVMRSDGWRTLTQPIGLVDRHDRGDPFQTWQPPTTITEGATDGPQA